MSIFRVAHFLHGFGVPVFPRLLYILNRLLFAVVLPPSVSVGKDTLFRYSGLGVVVHARCRIGSRVQISQNVTLGGRSDLFAVPVIFQGFQYIRRRR